MTGDREIRQQELARLLLEKARQDFVLVKTVGKNETIANEIIGFHVQQSIEKALKAALTRRGIEYEYTHDISLLYQQVNNIGLVLPQPLDAVEALTAFAVQFRYTIFQAYEAADFDRTNAAELAAEFIQWAETIVESDPS